MLEDIDFQEVCCEKGVSTYLACHGDNLYGNVPGSPSAGAAG
jgi:hypothetical protein